MLTLISSLNSLPHGLFEEESEGTSWILGGHKPVFKLLQSHFPPFLMACYTLINGYLFVYCRLSLLFEFEDDLFVQFRLLICFWCVPKDFPGSSIFVLSVNSGSHALITSKRSPCFSVSDGTLCAKGEIIPAKSFLYPPLDQDSR